MFQMLHRKLRIKLFFRGRVLQNTRIARGRGRQNNAYKRRKCNESDEVFQPKTLQHFCCIFTVTMYRNCYSLNLF